MVPTIAHTEHEQVGPHTARESSGHNRVKPARLGAPPRPHRPSLCPTDPNHFRADATHQTPIELLHTNCLSVRADTHKSPPDDHMLTLPRDATCCVVESPLATQGKVTFRLARQELEHKVQNALINCKVVLVCHFVSPLSNVLGYCCSMPVQRVRRSIASEVTTFNSRELREPHRQCDLVHDTAQVFVGH